MKKKIVILIVTIFLICYATTVKSLSRIEVTSPKSDSIWDKDLFYDIEWTYTPDIKFVDIRLYKNNSFERIIVLHTENNGTFLWTVPSDLPMANDYQIKVSDSQKSSIYDFSDNFRIEYLWAEPERDISPYTTLSVIIIVLISSIIALNFLAMYIKSIKVQKKPKLQDRIETEVIKATKLTRLKFGLAIITIGIHMLNLIGIYLLTYFNLNKKNFSYSIPYLNIFHGITISVIGLGISLILLNFLPKKKIKWNGPPFNLKLLRKILYCVAWIIGAMIVQFLIPTVILFFMPGENLSIVDFLSGLDDKYKRYIYYYFSEEWLARSLTYLFYTALEYACIFFATLCLINIVFHHLFTIYTIIPPIIEEEVRQEIIPEKRPIISKKPCPFCESIIDVETIVCPNCGINLKENLKET